VTRTLAERYLLLGLRIGRHVDGIVDAYFGPPGLAAAADAEQPIDPGTLADEAGALLAELGQGWLHDQVVGLRTYADVLAGEPVPYADEVEHCYGVRPTWTDEDVFTAAHSKLDALLPGEGPLAERKRLWEESIRVPAARVETVVARVIEEARASTGELVELPAGERVELELVDDVPWLAFCEYLGDGRSSISVNIDLPLSGIDALRVALHETYPGHHTERCCKEERLVRGQGLLEETIVLVPTPQSLVSEGIAELAPEVLLAGDAGSRLEAILRDEGIAFDLAHALEVERAQEPCRWAEVNAAILLHDEGAGEAQTQSYLERWALVTPELAAHLVRFMSDPTSRSYVLTYSAGRELCRRYVAGEPERFRRLLTEQVRVADLLAEPALPG
jgi:hypothetical protein